MKKCLSVLLALAMLCFLPLVVSAGSEKDFAAAVAYCLGDLDGDTQVTAIDARLALRASAELEELTPQQAAAADVFLNGEIEAVGARKILRVSANLEKLWNVPMLTAQVENQVRRDGFEALPHSSSVENFLIVRYYGIYNGSVVVMFADGPFVQIPHTETVGGIEVSFGDPNTIYVWKDGKVLWWKTAYEQGLLTIEDVQQIADIHKSGGVR